MKDKKEMGRLNLKLHARLAAFGLAAGLAMLGARPAAAQTPSPLAEWQYSSGVQLQRLFEPTVPTWQTELGLGGQYAPDADGIKHFQVTGGPVVDIRYKDIWFISTGEGIGANLFSFRHISVGGAISYDLGRSPHIDGYDLNGLGTIHMTPEAKFFATTVLSKSFPLTIRVDIRKQLGASFGYVGDVGAYLPMPGSSPKFTWFVGPTVTLADSRYMQTYFGVSHTQAASTRYHYYKAYGGLKSAGLGITAIYFVNPHWLLVGDFAYDRLLGAAAQSPITQTVDEPAGTLSAIYKF